MSSLLKDQTKELSDLIKNEHVLLVKVLEFLEEKVTFQRISRLIHITYPEFFMRGITIRSRFFGIGRQGNLIHEGIHYPQKYDQSLLVQFLQGVCLLYGFHFPLDIVGLLCDEIESDFSAEYLAQFPFVIRVVSGNSYKRQEYSYGFSLPSVEFVSYDFVEIQGTGEEIVLDKLVQLPEEDHVVMVVDDTALELCALGGFPGPYVKSFFRHVDYDELGPKLEALGDTRAVVCHSIGVLFQRKTYLYTFRFPVLWGVSSGEGHSFDPYCYYKHTPLIKLNGHFRQIIAFWIKVLLVRNFDRMKTDDQINMFSNHDRRPLSAQKELVSDGVEPNPGPVLVPIEVILQTLLLLIIFMSMIISFVFRYYQII
jgi:inosine/xanthosine triphosphate pyrophosphatase family protein